jgi:hypothetical protein
MGRAGPDPVEGLVIDVERHQRQAQLPGQPEHRHVGPRRPLPPRGPLHLLQQQPLRRAVVRLGPGHVPALQPHGGQEGRRGAAWKRSRCARGTQRRAERQHAPAITTTLLQRSQASGRSMSLGQETLSCTAQRCAAWQCVGWATRGGGGPVEGGLELALDHLEPDCDRSIGAPLVLERPNNANLVDPHTRVSSVVLGLVLCERNAVAAILPLSTKTVAPASRDLSDCRGARRGKPHHSLIASKAHSPRPWM